MPREGEAIERTRMMLDVYADLAEEYLAMPVIKGRKTAIRAVSRGGGHPCASKP